MPEPITPTNATAPRAVPRQRRRSRPPSRRQMREHDWRTLVGTYRLFSRLQVERTKHHLIDEADTVSRQAALVEEELEHLFPIRWLRLRPALLSEQATWWAEPHEDDRLTCRSCQLQPGGMPETIDPPPLHRIRG